MEPSVQAPVDFLPPAWHGPDALPLEIDIGCHKGTFLVAMAQLHPERNFIGIEMQFKRVEGTRKKIERLALPNATVVRGEGLASLRNLPARCADYIHVLFPDPWPKRRHHVRRLVQPEFLAECARILPPGGHLRLVTDDKNYATAMQETAAEAPDFVKVPIDERDYPPTEFQKKFVGLPIYSLLLKRR